MTLCPHCDKPAVVKGLCMTAYQRQRRNGTTDLQPKKPTRIRLWISLSPELAAKLAAKGLTVIQCVERMTA